MQPFARSVERSRSGWRWAVAVALVTLACGPSKPTEPGPDGGVTVTVSVRASAARVTAGDAVQLTATVTGSTDTAVSWLVNGVAGGNTAVGTIDASGRYVAPAVVPSPAEVVIRAVSAASASAAGEARLTVVDAALSGLLARYSTGAVRVEGPLAHGQRDTCTATGGLEYQARCTPLTESPVDWAQGDAFTVEWTGHLLVPAAGTWHLESDGPARGQLAVEVDGQALVDAALDGAPWSADVALSATKVPVRITFEGLGGANRLRFAWRGPDGVVAPVPRGHLSPRVAVVVAGDAAVTVEAGGANDFTATVLGSLDDSVTWTLEAGTCGADAGALSDSGRYTAGHPAATCTVTVVATSAADPSATARVVVTVTPRTLPVPTRLDETTVGFGEVRLVADAVGNALAVWVKYGAPEELWGARFDASSATWGTPFPLHLDSGNKGAHNLGVSGNAAGRVFIAYQQRYEPVPGDGAVTDVWVRSYDLASGVLGPPHTLDNAHEQLGRPAVAVAPNGNAVVAWYRDPVFGYRQMYGAGFSATAAAWSATQRIDAPDPSVIWASSAPTFSEWNGVAVDAEGNGAVIWSHRNDDGNSLRTNRWLAASRTWEGERVVRSATAESVSSERLVALGSTLLATWAERTPSNDVEAFEAVFDPTSATWGAPTRWLARAEGFGLSDLRTASNGTSLVAAAWLEAPSPGALPQAWGALRSATGTWSAPRRLDTESKSAGAVELQLNAAGQGVVVWAQAASGGTQRLPRAVPFDAAAGQWQPMRVVADAVTGSAHDGLSVAVDGAGAARLLWVQQLVLLTAPVP